jgi:serine/threonine protein kinase
VALNYLEGQNPQVIHRDIKPGNIIITALGRVYLVDFGIAIHKAKPGATGAGGQPTWEHLGTPGYSPPEQFQGQETPLADLYALGATMHHLLTGRDPTKMQPLFHYPPVRVLSPRVLEATSRIVAKALQNDPSRRYQSAAEMKRDVDRVLHPAGLLGTVRGRAIAVLVVLLLLAAAVVGTDEFAQGRPKASPPSRHPPTVQPVLPTATQVVIIPPPPATATPIPPATTTPVPTATAVPSPTTTAPVVPTNTPLPPTSAVERELRRVNIPPTTSASFTTEDNMIVDGDVIYRDFPVASQLAGELPIHATNIGRVAYTVHGGQVASIPLHNGATTIQFDGPVPDRAVDEEVQVPLYQHGCEGACHAIQVFFFDGSKVLSTCVRRGEHFHAADLTASPDPPCL